MILFVLDLFFKTRIRRLSASRSLPRFLAGGRIRIGYVQNRGLLLGLGRQRPKLACLVSLLSLVLLVGLLVWIRSDLRPLAQLGFFWVLLGGSGNLFDRLRRGFVTDYLNFPRIKKLRNLYFNLSDFGIFLGSILIFISL